MRKQLYLFIICILLLAPLSGCWSRKELNELAITLALGVDKDKDRYKVTAQIVNPGEVASNKGGGVNSPISIYTSTGKTIHSAVRRMMTKSPRLIYAAHLQLFVIGEELAKEDGIAKTLDLISRDPELRTDFFIIVTKGTTAEQALKILSIPLEKIPANKIFQSLKTSEEEWAATSTITLNKLISELISKGNNPVVTGLGITGDPKSAESMDDLRKSASETILKFVGIAVFKKDKLIGWLDEVESKGANYILDKVKSTIVEVSCLNDNDGLVGIKLVRAKSKVKGMMKNGVPMINVSIQGEANVSDVECSNLDLNKTETIYELEKEIENDIKGKMEAALQVAQTEYETDIFGFGEVIHRDHQKYWEKVKNNWDQEFVNLSVNFDVAVKIRQVGTIGNSFIEQLKE